MTQIKWTLETYNDGFIVYRVYDENRLVVAASRSKRRAVFLGLLEAKYRGQAVRIVEASTS